MRKKLSKREQWLRKCLGIAIVVGTWYSGVAEAGTVVDISTTVSDTIYGNGSGTNNTIAPNSSGNVYGNISEFKVNILPGAAVNCVVGALGGDWGHGLSEFNNNSVIANNASIAPNHSLGVNGSHIFGYANSMNNSVTLNNIIYNGSNSTIGAAIYYGGGGISQNNSISLSNITLGSDAPSIGVSGANISVCGKGDGNAYGQALDNNIVIDNSDLGEYGRVNGGGVQAHAGILVGITETEVPVKNAILKADGNSVIIKGNSKVGSVSAGESSVDGFYALTDDYISIATADNNKVGLQGNVSVVDLTGGEAIGNDASAQNNKFEINGANVSVTATVGSARGSRNVYADNNTANIDNNSVLVGGLDIGNASARLGNNSSVKLSASNNTATINTSTIGGNGVIGGYALLNISGASEGTNSTAVVDASNNEIIFNSGTVASLEGGNAKEVLGLANLPASASITVSASNNNIVINGGIVENNVIGGQIQCSNYSNAEYIAKDNIVTWKSGEINGAIIGDLRYTHTDEYLDWDATSNSTFNFYASSSNSNKTIIGLGNFKNYNFYIDNSVVSGSTLITVNNTVDMRQSNIGVAMTSDATLNIGDSIKLLSTQGLKTKENIENTLSGGKLGRAGGENIYDVYDFTITNDGYNLNATVGNRSSNPKSEDIPASRQPEVALIDDKLDIVDTAYQMSIGKSEPVIYYDFNYTDVKKGDLTLRGSDNVIGSATTKGDKEKKNTITQGPFIEYGNGSFGGKNFYSTGGVEGSGKNKKYGAGYLFRQVKFGKHHFDAYVRAGKINNEFRSFMQGVGNVDYDNSDVYYAAHFGYGQYMPIDPHTTMDVYGKYFYKILPGSSTTTHVSTGGDINTEFDALTSHKFRIGSKITWDYMEEKKKMMFADLALEHELSHTQTSRLGDRVISNSSGADTTAVMEVGYRQVFGPKDAFLFTADLQGYAGTRTGFGGNIGVRFNF